LILRRTAPSLGLGPTGVPESASLPVLEGDQACGGRTGLDAAADLRKTAETDVVGQLSTAHLLEALRVDTQVSRIVFERRLDSSTSLIRRALFEPLMPGIVAKITDQILESIKRFCMRTSDSGHQRDLA
jgi:hypothetical protein